MLAEFVDKIKTLAEPKTFEVQGRTYSTVEMTEVKPEVVHPDTFHVSGLDGLCKMILHEGDLNLGLCGGPLFVRVNDCSSVDVFTEPAEDGYRNYLYTASAPHKSRVTGWADRESRLIQLRSEFIPNEGSEYLLNLLSRWSDESTVTSEDNGVTQTVTTTAGVSLKQQVNVKPRVFLKPFRTFVEVEQPESEFLVRVDKNNGVGLFEADGGIWQLEAKKNIAAYLEERLSGPVKDGSVVILL